MPEGPEIRRAADKIAAALVGRPVREIWFAFESLKPYEQPLTGATVTAVETHGKGMVTRFDNHLNIYSHNQLYGVWMIRPAYEMPETNRSLRLAIHNDSYSALLYSASEIEVLPDETLSDHPFLSRIGPDVLHESVTAAAIAERFADERFKRKRLYTLLLDQQFLAGIGNYLRSEICFVAGVHPEQRPLDCSPESRQALAEAALTLTRRSYETQGITNDPALAEKLKKEGVARSRYRHWVFNREGQSCFNCGEAIVKDEMGGRRIYICPTCQPKPIN